MIAPVGAGRAVLGAIIAWLTGRGFGRWLFAAGALPALAMTACGGGAVTHNAGTPPGTYNLTVIGTFTSGSTTLAHNVTLTLTVS